jgi:hypothetical protein
MEETRAGKVDAAASYVLQGWEAAAASILRGPNQMGSHLLAAQVAKENIEMDGMMYQALLGPAGGPASPRCSFWRKKEKYCSHSLKVIDDT